MKLELRRQMCNTVIPRPAVVNLPVLRRPLHQPAEYLTLLGVIPAVGVRFGSQQLGKTRLGWR